ncbi:glycosyl transferase group 1 [Vibrio cholerae]|nr:putative glycosyltransferase [Vibrio cholerae]GIB64880.1 glycosyl transferase group 1 [Vibrio cholerae]
MNLPHIIKVTHINYYNGVGGAYKAMHRVHTFFKSKNTVESIVVTNDNVELESNSIMWKMIKKFERVILRLNGFNRLSPFSYYIFYDKRVLQCIDFTKVDILHLHWVGNGMVPFEKLNFIDKPLFISLHDFFPITGGCHLLGDCDGYKDGCKSCPLLFKSSSLARRALANKIASLKELNVTFICPSKWVAEVLKESYLYRALNPKLIVIPNMLDDDYNKDRSVLKSKIKKLKPAICYGAVGASTDKNKGFFRILPILERLSKSVDFQLIVFGDFGLSTILNNTSIDFVNHGHVSELELKKIYVNVDLTIVPSYQETFGQVALESIAMGTPVICFKGTGLDDIVLDGVNGFVCTDDDPEEILTRIKYCLENDFPYDSMSQSIEKFKSSSVGENLLEAYFD